MRLLQFLLAAQSLLGPRVSLLIVLMVVNAFLEGVALALLLPMLQMLSGDTGQSTGLVAGALSMLLNATGMAPTAMSAALLVVSVLAVSAVVAITLAHYQISLQAEYVARLQGRLFSALAHARWPFLRKLSDGDVIAAITVEAQRAGGAFYQLCLISAVLIFVGAQFSVALLLAPMVTVAVVAIALFLYILTYPFIRRALHFGEELTLQNSRLQSAATELVTAMKLVKSGAAEKIAVARMDTVVGSVRRVFHKSNFDLQIVRAVFEYGSGMFVIVALVIGSGSFGTSLEELIVVLAIFVRLFPKITALRQCLQSIELVLPAVTKLENLIAEAEKECEHVGGERRPVAGGPARIEIKGLTVLAPDGSRLLDGVDLSIAPGEMVAFVGRSGAGKTTLVDAVLGMVNSTAGQILINGLPLQETDLEEWRRYIGYMGQDAQLFDDTIGANIRWRVQNASDEDLVEVAQAAAVDRFVAHLRDGYATSAGSRGSRLSGGERQRVALARALLGSPRLLVLDEATSALDAETEKLVMDAILKLKGRVTILVIAHRLSSIRNCDKVVVLDRGAVIDSGSYEELARRRGNLRDMINMQGPPPAEV